MSHHRQYSLIYDNINVSTTRIMFMVEEFRVMAVEPDDECLGEKNVKGKLAAMNNVGKIKGNVSTINCL